ncbi:MAG: hypothetical protein J6V44_09645 [Methanobrevibacter sp.]|nr:hypothetical protein [Methanobrevibacter sp.]
MNKRQKQIFERYKNSTRTSLRDCYDSFSKDKEKAFKSCMQICSEHEGTRPRIIRSNYYTFNFGFVFKNNSSLYFKYIFPSLLKDEKGKRLLGEESWKISYSDISDVPVLVMYFNQEF